MNDAPRLTDNFEAVLTDINENDLSSAGDLVAEIVSGFITDVDGPAEDAIAVIELDNTYGAWQYTTDGANWKDFSPVTGEIVDISADVRLLAGDHLIRFVPDMDWSGAAFLTFRAWDRSGNAGDTADVSINGEATAFSSSTNTAAIIVNALPVTGLKATNNSPTVWNNETMFDTSVNTGNNIIYTWDFGDETSGSGASTGHTYSELGTYSVSITAENSVSTATATTYVTVCAESLIVTNGSDMGEGSLRYAIENICDGGVIGFAPNLPENTTITLNSPLVLYKNMSIRNSNTPNLTLSGNNSTRVFEIIRNIIAEIEGLTITRGMADDGFGGAIYNQGGLVLTRCTLFGNSAELGVGIDKNEEITRWTNFSGEPGDEAVNLLGIGAGAIFNSGTMTLTHCTLSGNHSSGDAESLGDVVISRGSISGGVFNSGTITLTYCTLFNNNGDGTEFTSVGGVYSFRGDASLSHTIIAGNTGSVSPDVYGIFTSKGYNLIGDAAGSVDFTEEKGDLAGNTESQIDPLLGPLGNNGGLTQTHALFPAARQLIREIRISRSCLILINGGKTLRVVTTATAMNQRQLISVLMNGVSVSSAFPSPVSWDSSAEKDKEKYYYLFNKHSDEIVTKRNVPRIRPFRATRVTSEKITGDDIPYYFHVAPVNQRGRIGDTQTFGFRIDTVPPSNVSVTTSAKTVSRFVALTLGAAGAAEMYLSNTSYGEGGEWENWVKTKEWKLPEGEGLKKIYVQFRDRVKNTANGFGSITATAGKNGSITSSGKATLNEGEDKT